MFKIQSFHFYKTQIIYCSVVDGDAFFSFHNREGLTDQQAKGRFVREHNNEVYHLLGQKKRNEAEKMKIIL